MDVKFIHPLSVITRPLQYKHLSIDLRLSSDINVFHPVPANTHISPFTWLPVCSDFSYNI